jgi:SHS2 domain-containing protein
MSAKFEIIDHTADIGMVIRGDSLKQLFENAATGMFSMITDMEKVKPAIKKEVQISSSDRESLLVDWLNELLFLFEAEFLVFGRFEITELTENKLKAICHGEKITSKHEIKREVKAATYHMLNLVKEDSDYKAQVIFDI